LLLLAKLLVLPALLSALIGILLLLAGLLVLPALLSALTGILLLLAALAALLSALVLVLVHVVAPWNFLPTFINKAQRAKFPYSAVAAGVSFD
jgi:hypothetical protein